MVQNLSSVISCDEYDLGRTDLVQHEINTEGHKPVKQYLRKVPRAQLQIIDDYLDTLSESRWFSTLDMRSGYFQVQMNKEDSMKTAFTTRKGLFQFDVMPQGLCNAAATFQRLMSLILAGLNYDVCLVYIDDVIVYSTNLEEHLKRLEVILSRLRDAGLKLRPDKCRLLQKQVKFLGHVISEEGVATDEAKVELVKTWPQPRRVRDVRSFLGLCSYYRRFVKDFAKVAEPLHKLTRKSQPFYWDISCQEAFEKLKVCLTTAPIMAYPRDNEEYILDCDACDLSIGAVLSQRQEGTERVIAYASRLCSRAELNYCTTRKELLAVVHFCKQFRQYLLGRHFTVRTDHAALKWLRRTPEPIGQQGRWLEILESFDFDVVHRAGIRHENADAMSRRPCNQCEGYLNVAQVNEEEAGVLDPWNPDQLAEEQASDPELSEIYALLTKDDARKPDWSEMQSCSEVTKWMYNQWDVLEVKEGVIYRRSSGGKLPLHERLLVAPVMRRKGIMKLAHEGMTGGHMGIQRTKDQVRRRAYWPGWSKDVQRFCQACQACARYKRGAPPRQGLLEPIETGSPFEKISIDITGPHPKSSKGNVYILTLMDQFSKWAEAYPIRNQEASTVARVLVNQVFTKFGFPLQILSDQGPNFESTLFSEMCKVMGVDKIRTSSYHPRCNGMLERFHRTLNSMLGKVVKDNQRDWDEWVPQVLAAYRATEHSVTKFSPNYLILGRENRAPIDLVLGIPGDDQGGLSKNEYVEQLRERMIGAYATVRENLK